MRKRTGNYTLLVGLFLTAFHCVCLSCSCLPIGEDCSIVTFKNTLDNRQCHQFEDIFLFAPWLESHVKTEHPLFLAYIFLVVHHYLSSILENFDDFFMPLLDFVARKRSATDCHLHALSLLHLFKNNELQIDNELSMNNNMQHSLDQQQKRNQAADKIQKLWRSYTNRKIYKYYRDIIFFKCKGNPAKLLKGINPTEAQLLETAVDCHVRFRLGGDTFPPNIYYKVFSKSNVVDINAFAPRDYSSLPRQVAKEEKVKFSTYQLNRKDYENEGWYLRNDNNGWRPISHKMFIKTDYVELYSAKKVNFYHHKKELRDEKYYKKQRLAKLKWLKNMYMNAKQPQEAHLLQQMQQAEEAGQGKILAAGLNQDQQVIASKLEDRDFDVQSQEMADLLQWTEGLNFESYVKDWYQLSTSESSKDFVPKFVNENYNVLI